MLHAIARMLHIVMDLPRAGAGSREGVWFESLFSFPLRLIDSLNFLFPWLLGNSSFSSVCWKPGLQTEIYIL